MFFYPEIGEWSSEAMGSAEHDGGVARDQDGATAKPPDDAHDDDDDDDDHGEHDDGVARD